MTTLLIGTYTVNTPSKGIYLIKVNPENFEILRSQYITAENPSFLSYLASKNTLYFVEELGNNKGRIKAMELNPDTGETHCISDYPTSGSAPCHIAISPNEDHMIVSNYMSGNFITYALDKDGSIERELSIYQFNGKSTHPKRQQQSHIHSAFYSPEGSKIFVQDLGADCVYQFNASAITRNDQSYIQHKTLAAAGPRHLAFSKKNRAYLLNELNGYIDVLSLDAHQQIDQLLQRISLNTPEETKVQNLGAQIRLSVDEKYIYASNRGECNQIAVYQVNDTGYLELVQLISSQGTGPRHFEFSQDQDYLYVANQQSSTIQQFTRAKDTGLLSYTGKGITIPSPTFIAII